MGLVLRNISIGYSAPVVSSIDAELHSGDFICLVGRNGSGKSTLLKTLAGLIKPVDGALSPIYDNEVGIVLTQVPDLRNTTVFELVSYGRIPHQNILASLRKNDIEAIDAAIETVGIKALRNRQVSELSDGEKQKAMIARALAQGTKILLLDEPSAFLDYPSKRELMLLLKELAHNEGKAILLSTHDVELAKSFADTIWHLKDGLLTVSAPSAFIIDSI